MTSNTLDKLIHLREFGKEWVTRVHCTWINLYKIDSYIVKVQSITGKTYDSFSLVCPHISRFGHFILEENIYLLHMCVFINA